MQMGSRLRKDDLPKPEFPEEFQASVEEAKENTEKDFYVYLNVSPDCGEEEIKAAYKRLAMIWHPDRHKDEESRAIATAKFAKLTHIHDMLTDPKKRKLYDLYGEGGLSSGLEVGAHLKTAEQVREEYMRLLAKKNQKRIESKLGVTGVLQTNLQLKDYLGCVLFLFDSSSRVVRLIFYSCMTSLLLFVLSVLLVGGRISQSADEHERSSWLDPDTGVVVAYAGQPKRGSRKKIFQVDRVEDLR
eukprot:764135-Hanusia_phi.AAC.1